jgi:signal transduction histidine kinase
MSDTTVGGPPTDAAGSLIEPLWRATIIFRIIALAFAMVVVAANTVGYQRLWLAWTVLAIMTLWTVFTSLQFLRGTGRRTSVVLADVVLTAVLQYSSVYILSASQLHSTFPTITTVWTCGPVIAAGVLAGPRSGLLAGLFLSAVNVVTRGVFDADMGRDAVLLTGLGFLLGLAASTARQSAERLSRAMRVEAATAERERLARSIHDGVLQVLARLRRLEGELTGEPAELARLAGEQELALRTLMTTTPLEPQANGKVDLNPRLRLLETQRVHVSLPATVVEVPAFVAGELAAVVHEALLNVSCHGGPNAQAWVLLEDLGTSVSLSVRDNGPGIPPGRLAEAETEGRMGVAHSMRGRVANLGGTIRLDSRPETGTEWEIHVPIGPRSGAQTQ